MMKTIKYLRLCCLALLFNFVGPLPTGFAVEIYGFVTKECQTTIGMIIGINDEEIRLLTVHGELKLLPRNELQHILVYNLVNNPIEKLDLAHGLRDNLREIYLTDVDKPTLVGWPVKFIENLIVFYAVDGKTNLIDQDKILIISAAAPPADDKVAKPIVAAVKTEFGLGNNLPECAQKPHAGEAQPTRMISDKIKIGKFLFSYEQGFNKLGRFQERIRFYARPFLFTRGTRLGLAITNEKYQVELPIPVPLYFQWSTGKPYSHQSQISVGKKTVEWLPNVEPVFAARSDFKLHFFNASLVGNLFSLSAGSSFLVNNSSIFGSYFSQFADDDVFIVPQFNYLALTGVDYGAYSFAFGVYYPIFGLGGNGVFREILADRAVPISRFLYTVSNLRYKLLFADIIEKSSRPADQNIKIVSLSNLKNPDMLAMGSASLVENLGNFRFATRFMRAGVDWEIDPMVKVGIDEIVLTGRYDELFQGQDNHIKFQEYITATYLRQQFADYVALQANLNVFRQAFQYQFGSSNESQNTTRYSVAGAVEFML